MKLPVSIERQILELIGLSGLNWRSQKHFRKKIKRMQDHMFQLSEEFSLLKPIHDVHSEAYFAYNFPVNLMKAMISIQQLQDLYPAVLPDQKKLNICDIGCGEGAGMLGIYFGLHDFEQIKFTAFDTSLSMLKKCTAMTRSIKEKDQRVHFKLLRQDLSHGLLKKKNGKYDIIILANSLAEMFTAQEIPVYFIERLLKSCSCNGVILIIEPATKDLSRRLMMLRDRVINLGKAQVLMPCLHAEKCPLVDVRQQKDWCHQSIVWSPPEYLKILNQGLNREIDRLKFSYLVITQKNALRKKVDAYLSISPLLREKGKQRCFICTPQGRIELVRLKRDRSKTNRGFDRIRKSDIIMLDNVVKKKPDYWQVINHSKIKIVNRPVLE